MRVVANGVWGNDYGGACDDRYVERVAVVVVCVSGGSVCVCVCVCVSSVGVTTMCGVRGGGGLELFGSSAGGWRGRACIPYISWCRMRLSGAHGCDLGLAMLALVCMGV